LKEHLSELEKKLSSLLEHEHVFVGLDRDGTIVPHMDNPLQSLADQELCDLIDALAQCRGISVGIISARALDVLERDFGRDLIALAGVYGLEISIPGKPLIIQDFAQKVVPDIKHIRDKLAEFASPEMGAIMERDLYSVWLGWRRMSEANKAEMVASARAITAQYSAMELNLLDDGLEIVPKTTWNKASAMEKIVAEVFPPKTTFACIYAGDAPADESVFRWVNERQGLSIFVGGTGAETAAEFRLENIHGVRELLKQICLSRG